MPVFLWSRMWCSLARVPLASSCLSSALVPIGLHMCHLGSAMVKGSLEGRCVWLFKKQQAALTWWSRGVGRGPRPPHSGGGCRGWFTVWAWASDAGDVRASSGFLTTLTVRAIWNVTVKQKAVLKNPQTASLQIFCGLGFPCLLQKLNL